MSVRVPAPVFVKAAGDTEIKLFPGEPAMIPEKVELLLFVFTVPPVPIRTMLGVNGV